MLGTVLNLLRKSSEVPVSLKSFYIHSWKRTSESRAMTFFFLRKAFERLVEMLSIKEGTDELLDFGDASWASTYWIMNTPDLTRRHTTRSCCTE